MTEEEVASAEFTEWVAETAKRTGYPEHTYHVVGFAVWEFLHDRQSAGVEGKLGAEEVCAGVLNALSERYLYDLETVIEWIEIESSEDLGRVIFELSECGFLIDDDEEDQISDFDEIYSLQNLDGFLNRHGIKRNTKAKRHRNGMFLLGAGVFGLLLALLILKVHYGYVALVALLGVGLIMFLTSRMESKYA